MDSWQNPFMGTSNVLSPQLNDPFGDSFITNISSFNGHKVSAVDEVNINNHTTDYTAAWQNPFKTTVVPVPQMNDPFGDSFTTIAVDSFNGHHKMAMMNGTKQNGVGLSDCLFPLPSTPTSKINDEIGRLFIVIIFNFLKF